LIKAVTAREKAQEQLRQAQKMETIGQLTGGIAHDFNNLLMAVMGNLDLLRKRLPDDPRLQRLVEGAIQGAERGASLTQRLLAFARQQDLRAVSVDLRALIEGMVDLLERSLGPRVELRLDIPQGLPPARIDANQLELAILNLAINARDAMPDGGTLHFRVAACGALPGDIRAELEDPSAPDDGFVAISIADTGSGMPEEVRERAFEPFFTTKEAGRGTGLGLSTVYGFVKQSKGAIKIDSAPGAGTTLTLYIPRPWDIATPSPTIADASHGVPVGLEVLLVEDDAEVRTVVRTFLDMLGCKVSVASSAEQALLALGPDASFDLLLTDIALGSGMRGTKLAAHAQERFPRLAILLMSGFSAELLDADRESPPSWELLRKPYSREELAHAMARVLGSPSTTDR
jgi:nitrogen-specific signal transduction histidine kinase/CheY-like chemotaxis protein